MSKNSDSEGMGVVIGLIYLVITTFFGGIVPIYAIYRDFQHGKFFWAVMDFTFFFPVGTIRGLMYYFGWFI